MPLNKTGVLNETIPCLRLGYTFRRFSWFKHKVLSYSVTLHVPSLIATERAKCGRAMNALRACVRERDGLRVKVQETTGDVQEVDENAQVRFCRQVNRTCMFAGFSIPTQRFNSVFALP